MGLPRRAAPVAAVLFLALAAGAAAGDGDPLPVSHFVSLKTEGANGRRGPGVEHRVDWIYERAGLPLEVTGESGAWRRVRDPDGAQVWIHESSLSPRRTAMIQAEGDVPLRDRAAEGARPVAILAPGVVGSLTGCSGDWRRIVVRGRVGWVPAAALWGAEDCGGL